MKHPAFLSRFCPEASTQLVNILPKLKQLSLRGVHVDWDSLAGALDASQGGLGSLELASHCADVRPSKDQFRALLSSVPALRRLVISGSGPEITEEMEEGNGGRDYTPVALHHLENLNIGYRTTMEGRAVLELLDAPNVKTFILEDATYPGDPEEINGGSLLTYVGSKRFIGNETAFRAEYPPPSPLPQAIGEVDANLKPVRRRKSSASDMSEESNAAFPLLENVTLKSVKSSAQPLRTFFNGLAGLRKLELVGMSMQSVQALLPSASAAASSCPCPCPQLQSLSIKDHGRLQVRDLEFVVGDDLAREREGKGASRLRELDIHVDAARADQVVAAASSSVSYGTKIRVISDDDDEDGEDEEEDDMDDCGMDMDVDPFRPGGAFNDPAFDQYYSAQMLISPNSH